MSLAEVAASGGSSGCLSVDIQWECSLGRGGFGQVFKGVVYPSGESCAIKTAKFLALASDAILSSADVDSAGMLKDEAALMSQLKHANIIACYGLFEQ